MACNCLDTEGYKRGEKIRTESIKEAANYKLAQSVAFAILNANDFIKNYKRQRDIADRTLKLSEDEQRHLRQHYWPRELDFLDEFGTDQARETADIRGRRIAGRLVASISKKFAADIAKLKCNASRYCTSSIAKQMQDIMMARSQAMANAKILGRMIGFNEVEALADRDFGRRTQAIGLGKGLMSEATRLYAGAADSLITAGQGISDRLNSSLEQAGYAWGQRQQAGDTLNRLNYRTPTSRAPFTPNLGGGIDPYGTDIAGNYFNQQGITDMNQGFIDGMTIQQPVNAGHGLDAIQTGDYSSNFRHGKAEANNEGMIGHPDLVRDGSHTYRFTDSRGDSGSITVNMSDFGFANAKGNQPDRVV